MGRTRKNGNHTPQKNNSIKDSVKNEENGYPATNPNKTIINITKEPSDIYKKSKEEILEEITEKLMEKTQVTVNQNVQMHSRNFKTPKIKNVRTHRNKLREDFNKHQSETKDTIKKGIYALKTTPQNIKENLNKDMEKFRKKNQIGILEVKSPFSQTKNTVEATRLD
jgi:hypothetical protein